MCGFFLYTMGVFDSSPYRIPLDKGIPLELKLSCYIKELIVKKDNSFTKYGESIVVYSYDKDLNKIWYDNKKYILSKLDTATNFDEKKHKFISWELDTYNEKYDLCCDNIDLYKSKIGNNYIISNFCVYVLESIINEIPVLIV
ncbi:MAG: hypothetical protein RsTaC01_0220 [Candidatus Paraimprobicoccus trichonymphae]|uniref:Uncharacterized protein n=1 Tax=Candidatus Paraimprobicoccus trichonymphae TaxID=3033793 RepID=A0AA48IHA0_9FIRM|nr:MAG: hypothetical protein RsTaC01_0220 [Candidatus Paraimprobicoccus trichonymphae]